MQRLLFIFTLSLTSCAWMGSDGIGMFEGEEVVSRSQAMADLRAAMILSIGKCPENNNAAMFGQDYIVPGELSSPYYLKKSIDDCVIAILSMSCGLNPDQSSLYVANLYRTVLRLCNPRPAGN